MANSRRGAPPDLKGTLGTLLRTTLYQVGAVKDAAVREARQRRGWIDTAVLARKRREALADLGEILLDLAASGELGGVEEFPEVARALDAVHAIDAELAEADRADGAGGRDESGNYSAVSSRHAPPPRKSSEPMRVWRPVLPDDDPEPEGGDAADDPGPTAASPRPRSSRPPLRRAERRGGGIRFVEEGTKPEDPGSEADLEQYMHKDDVPRAGDGSDS